MSEWMDAITEARDRLRAVADEYPDEPGNPVLDVLNAVVATHNITAAATGATEVTLGLVVTDEPHELIVGWRHAEQEETTDD
jgi:hypothetical protein